MVYLDLPALRLACRGIGRIRPSLWTARHGQPKMELVLPRQEHTHRMDSLIAPARSSGGFSQSRFECGECVSADVVLDSLGIHLGDPFWNAKGTQECHDYLVPALTPRRQ